MAIVKGWADDSRREDIWAVGGYCGTDRQWQEFEREWATALRASDVPWFHGREMGNSTGVYAKWQPPEDHQPEIVKFMGDLAAVINRCHLFGFLCIVREHDLRRFNTEHNLTLQPYPLAASACMMLAARSVALGFPTEVIFDRVEKIHSKLGDAQKYVDSWSVSREQCKKVVPIPLPKTNTWRNVPALQAADFLVGELRRHHERVSEWFDTRRDMFADTDEGWVDLQEWILSKYGTFEKAVRKSAVALLDKKLCEKFIWDHRTLTEAHNLRGGVWSPTSSKKRRSS